MAALIQSEINPSIAEIMYSDAFEEEKHEDLKNFNFSLNRFSIICFKLIIFVFKFFFACTVFHLYFSFVPVEKCMCSVVLIATVLPAFYKFLKVLSVQIFSNFFLVRFFFQYPVKHI